MRRRLTAREWVLLALLGIILVICGYVLLFYMPQTAERDRYLEEAESIRVQTRAAQLRLEDKRRMEQELEELLCADASPIADYDNLKPIMVELDSVLALTKEYTLTFSTADASQSIVRRSISMTFTADSYEYAKEVLQRLHGSDYRCMLESVSLNLGQGAEGAVTVSGTIVFFEYRPSPSEQTA